MFNDRSLLNEFICEAREHLVTIEEDFLVIEKKNEDAGAEIINRIFRAIHTIKGGAGFLGCIAIGKLAHSMETVLSMVRDGSFNLKQSTINVLFIGVDKLRSLFDNIDESNNVDVSELIKIIDNEIMGNLNNENAKEYETHVSITGPDSASSDFAFDITAYDLKHIPAEHKNLYILSYDLSRFEKQKGLSPVALIRELLKMGTIVDGFLKSKSDSLYNKESDADLEYKVLYATMADDAIIGVSVELDDKHIVKVNRDQFKSTPDTTIQKNEPTKSDENKTNVESEIIEQGKNKGDEKDDASSRGNDTIRIKLDILDRLMMLAGELVLVRNQELMNVDRNNPASRNIAQKLNIVTTDLQETIMRTRMQPIGTIFGRFSRIVRDLGVKLNKKIELEMFGNEVELDKTILEALVDPLVHIVRNSCDHGIEVPATRLAAGKNETGHIILKAYHEGGQMIVEVSDDGKGIDADRVKQKVIEKGLKNKDEISRMSQKEIQSFIFLPGFSTTDTISDVSGRGVGMDVVKTSVERLGGMIDLTSEKGRGTIIILRLPLTLAIIPSLIVRSGNARYAIPQINLEELVCLYDENVHNKIECAGSKEVYRLRNQLLPIVHLSEIFSHKNPLSAEDKVEITERSRALREKQHKEFFEALNRGDSAMLSLNFAVLKVGAARFGLCIDNVIGTEEIVVKPMHRAVKHLGIYSGATVLGDGSVALILDVLGIARHAGIEFNEQANEATNTMSSTTHVNKRGVLMFKSGPDELFAVDMAMVRRVERIEMVKIERIGSENYIAVNGISTSVITIDKYINVSPCQMADEMFLILPKKSSKPVGILISKIVDIGEFEVTLNTESYQNEFVKGSAILKEKMTLFLDFENILCKEAGV